MSPADDARAEFDEVFLGEVARLLPGVEVVRLRYGERANGHAAEAVPPQALTTAAQDAARQLVGAWSVTFGDEEHPGWLSVRWSALGGPDVVHPEAVGRLVAAAGDRSTAEPDFERDAEAAAARLRRTGWSTAIRSSSADGFNLLGRLDGYRLDVVVRRLGGLRTARVSGPPLIAGDFAPRLARGASAQIRWPSSR